MSTKTTKKERTTKSEIQEKVAALLAELRDLAPVVNASKCPHCEVPLSDDHVVRLYRSYATRHRKPPRRQSPGRPPVAAATAVAVAELREKGLTTREIESRLGVSRTTIYRREGRTTS